MKYVNYVIKRYFFTAMSKVAAVIATKVKATLTFNLLAWFLKKRDETLIRESKYCMLKTIAWQEKAKKCIIAHHQYEKEFKNNEDKK